MVLRIEHFVGAGKTGLLQGAQVQFPYRDQPLEEVGVGNGVRLVEHTLVAGAGGAGLVCVNQRAEACDIIDDGVFAVGGAGAHDQQHLVRRAVQHIPYILVVGGFILSGGCGGAVHSL